MRSYTEPRTIQTAMIQHPSFLKTKRVLKRVLEESSRVLSFQVRVKSACMTGSIFDVDVAESKHFSPSLETFLYHVHRRFCPSWVTRYHVRGF